MSNSPLTELDPEHLPVLEGPVTRSGRKRKNLAPVKSSGKKKNKMINRSPPQKINTAAAGQGDPVGSPVVVPATPGPDGQPEANLPAQRLPQKQQQLHQQQSQQHPQTDLAAVLAAGLDGIKNSMKEVKGCLGGMESRLGGKIDSLEEAVSKNKTQIEILTTGVEKNAERVAALENRVVRNEQEMEERIGDCLLYTSPSPRDRQKSRMPSSA